MKQNTKRGFLYMLLATVFISSSMAQSQQGQGFGPRQGQNNFHQQNPGIERIVSNLSEDQKAELKVLRTAHLKEMRDFRNQMGEIQARQRTLMSENPIDQKATGKIIDQKTALQNKQMKAQVAHKAAIKEVLTEEQVNELEEFQARHRFAKQRTGRGQMQAANFRPQHRNAGKRNL